MDCHEAKSKWSNYLSGEVRKEQQIKIREHVSQCHHCRENLELAKWILTLREHQQVTPPKYTRLDIPRTNKWKKPLLLAATIIVACFILFPSNKDSEGSVKVLSIESSTTYISENEHRVTYYHYYLGEHND